MAKQQHSAEFTRAVSRLTLTNIFFTALLYNLELIRDDELKGPDGSPGVACTDGVRLIYNATTLLSMFTDAERVSLLAHEIMHVILFHSLRRGIREPLLWNVACDFVVNGLLQEYGFAMGKTITPAQGKAGGKGWLLDPAFKGLSAEQVYDLLFKSQQQDKTEGCSGPGDGSMKPGPTGYDVKDYDATVPENGGKPKAEVEREIGIATEKALQAAKAAGQLSAGMKRIFGDAQVVHEPWYDHLRRYMNTIRSAQYNWNRINARRAVLFGIVSPDTKSEKMGKIAVGIDCSGSITSAQLSSMGAHLSDIARECNPESITAIYFDSKVCHVETFEGPDYDIKLEPHGGGGTCFEPVFKYVEQEMSAPQLMLMFTDLYGSFPENFHMCDTLWITATEGREVPFGEIILADFND